MQKFDIFGSPFVLEMGIGKASMKTNLGGILSLLVLATALAYFVYLNYMYGTGNIQPKVTSLQQKITKNSYIPLKSNLISFDILNQETDEFLMMQQKLLNLDLISYTATLQQTDGNGKRITPDINIPVRFCSELTDDTDVEQEAQCLDFSALTDDEAQFITYAGKGFDTRIYIELNSLCTGVIQTCLDSAIYEQYIFSDDVEFIINIKEQQFNSNKQSLETNIVKLAWDLDSSLLTTSKISLQVSEISLQKGFFLSPTQNYTHLSDAVYIDSYKTRGSNSNIGQNVISRFFISVDSIQTHQIIQFPQYPEILAQFMSVLNVLLLLKVLGVIFAQVEINQFFVNQKMKKYYSQTALKLIRQQEEEKSDKTQQGFLSNQSNVKVQKLTKDEILKQLKQLEEKDINQELAKQLSVSYPERIIRTLKGEQKQDYMKKKRSNKDLYETLFYQATQSKDVFELQSELLQIKKILAIVLTPYQYAAIKCCGTSLSDQIPFLLDRMNNNDSKKIQIQPEQLQKEQIELESQTALLSSQHYNHIELIDKVDYDDQFFQTQLDKFLSEAEKGFSNLDEHEKKVNERLLDCLNKTYGFTSK
ncbi:transmembrane protein, putative (macronuclear) [Tetrahymena thermophila SB210]|uniref:Transmembrane protein, putative n=1 Tax=Tetrahymena thermophila (strain SB210) TaxID=312017 RepID=Q248F3_TETTS|nr:transmembrane protein, putative [Tetrahymena thermophila SB210]EAS04092.2 transmembrane protein, putative [Tetrahymena thermophila SB210]|eukprot:XP_001024337.2 transmembrane protein, putative [Tetrahymena thermophila SB210]